MATKTAFRIARHTFAVVGVALTALIAIGVTRDVQSFDQTRGGYEAPYTGYTGTPIDWADLDVTATGMAHRGHVVNILINCTTGMMTFEVFKLHIPFRPFSPRALAVHKPREACMERNFSPEF